MDAKTTQELQEKIGFTATQVIGTLGDQIREIYEYLHVQRIAHTIGFKLQKDPRP